jgi:hypothetical protein
MQIYESIVYVLCNTLKFAASDDYRYKTLARHPAQALPGSAQTVDAAWEATSSIVFTELDEAQVVEGEKLC